MFEWDGEKNAANRLKHGISIEDSLPIFERSESDGLIVEDRRQDDGEERFVPLSLHGKNLPYGLRMGGGAYPLDIRPLSHRLVFRRRWFATVSANSD